MKEVTDMQTIRITITTPTPTNIVIKECESDEDEKIAELFKKLQEV